MPGLASRRLPLIAGLFAGVFFLLFADHFLSPPDCASYWAWAQAITSQMDFYFVPIYESLRVPAFYFYVTPTGRISNDWPIGTGMALLPVVRFGTVIAHAWILMLAAGVIALWLRAGPFSRTERSIAAAAIALGTPLGFYLLYGPFFSHVASFIVTTVFIILWDRTRQSRSKSEWLLLGLLLGCAAMIRPQNLVLAVVFLAEWRSLRPARVLLCAAAALFAFVPQMIVYWRLYGTPFSLPKIEEMQWLHPAFANMLLSDFHGVIPWTPVYLLGFAGLLTLLRTDRVLGAGLLLALLAQIYLNAANYVWWAGGSFGNRRLTDPAIIIAYGLAGLWNGRKERIWKFGTGAVIAACCFRTVWLLLAERRQIVPLDRYVSFSAPGFNAGMMRVWMEPLDTLRALIRPLHESQHLLGRSCGAVLAALGTWAAFACAPSIGRRHAQTFGRLLTGGLAALTIAVTIAALRTPPETDPQVLKALGRSSGVLWDNYVEQAYYASQKRDDLESERAARAAIRVRPKHYSGWYYLGAALYNQNRMPEAVTALDEVLKLYPKHPSAGVLRQDALNRIRGFRIQ